MLSLLPAQISHLNVLVDAPSTFEATFSLALAENFTHFPEAIAYMRQQAQSPDYDPFWNTRLIVYLPENKVIGISGYKGAPNKQGEVEIGYEIADSYQGRGFATQAAGMLVARAFTHEHVQLVSAHTLPEENASCRVLRKNGFVWQGVVHDPEDGDIWRWERRK